MMMGRKIKNHDRILIKNLRLRCIIGINDFERREKQDVLINVTMWTDVEKAAEKDDINLTVDYKKVNKSIVEVVEKSKFFLVESLAQKITEICLAHEKVSKVKVTVEKPGALRFAKSVGVEIVRKKDRAEK